MLAMLAQTTYSVGASHYVNLGWVLGGCQEGCQEGWEQTFPLRSLRLASVYLAGGGNAWEERQLVWKTCVVYQWRIP